MSKKHAEVKPALAEWVVHVHDSTSSLAIAPSRLLRDQCGGYTFTGPDGIIADFPPGTVSYVTRKPPAPRVPASGTGSTNVIHAGGGTILAGGGSSGSGGSGSAGKGATAAVSGTGGGTGAPR